jgi:MFS family permease
LESRALRLRAAVPRYGDDGKTARRNRRPAARPRRVRAVFRFVSGFIPFLPTFLAAARGYPETTASAAFASVFAVGLVTKPVTGTVSDRFDRTLVGTAGLVLAGVALLALVAAPSLPWVLVSLLPLAVGYKTQFPLADALMMETAPVENVGGDVGAARALFLGAGSLEPALVGGAATIIGYGGAYVSLAGVLLASAALLAWRYRRG